MARNLSLQVISKLPPAELKKVVEADYGWAVREYGIAQGWKVRMELKSGGYTKTGQWRSYSDKFVDIFAARHGKFVALELKTESGTATLDQREWLAVLAENADTVTMIATPRDAVFVMMLLD